MQALAKFRGRVYCGLRGLLRLVLDLLGERRCLVLDLLGHRGGPFLELFGHRLGLLGEFFGSIPRTVQETHDVPTPFGARPRPDSFLLPARRRPALGLAAGRSSWQRTLLRVVSPMSPRVRSPSARSGVARRGWPINLQGLHRKGRLRPTVPAKVALVARANTSGA